MMDVKPGGGSLSSWVDLVFSFFSKDIVQRGKLGVLGCIPRFHLEQSNIGVYQVKLTHLTAVDIMILIKCSEEPVSQLKQKI